MSGIGFDDLLQQAEQLSTGLDGIEERPRLQRNIQQVIVAGQRLCSKTPAVQDNAQIKASLLLSSQGKDVPAVSDRLKTLTAAQNFEPLEVVSDTDIEGFLRNERENAILAVVEEQKQKTFDEVERKHWQSRIKEWDTEKQKILSKLIGGDGTLNFTQEISDHIATSYYSSSATNIVNPRSVMDAWELAYARQIHIYNDRIIEGGISLNMAELCKSAAEKMKDPSLVSVWKLVACMTQAQLFAGQSSSVMTRRTSEPVLKSLVMQARKHLEESYVEYMQNCVYSRPHIAQRGGIPGTLHLVKSFLKVQPVANLQGFDDAEVDGSPLWGVIYYCLRCGDLDAALEVARQHDHIIPDFCQWLQEYATDGVRRLSTFSENKMKIQYKRVVRASPDPFKTAVYCIIGHCDVTDVHTEVAHKAEDYLWLKLCQVVIEEKTTASPDVLTLARLQSMLVQDYGEAHFNASAYPLLYFQILMLTCQFETALEFLSRFDSMRCHAAHVALALYAQDLLVTPASLHEKMLTMEPGDESPLTVVQRLNLARLIMMYTRKFELTDPREALNYFYLLRDIKTEGRSLLTHCTSELVRETGEFEMLLGKLNPDGSRRPGAVDKYCGRDVLELIAKVAADTEEKGLHEDAIQLYDLCGNHNQTLALLNRLLSSVVSSADSSHPDRMRLKNLSLTIAERYRSQAVESSQSLRSTFHLLLDLVAFFDLFHANRIEQALDVIKELQMLPVSTAQVQTKVTAFKLLSDEVRQNISFILLATMNLLARQCKQQENLNKSLATKSGDTVCSLARQQARALITFAGMLPYHLPADTTSRLVQLEVQMN